MYLLELGGEDDAFAACEAASAATGPKRVAPGLAVARGMVPDRVRGLAYTHAASELIGRGGADPESARSILEAAAIDRAGSVAVRATDVHGSTGVDTRLVERELGNLLVDRGFSVDLEEPDHVLRAVFSAGRLPDDDPRTTSTDDGPDTAETDGESDTAATDREPDVTAAAGPRGETVSVCALGWLAVESVRDFGRRKPTDRPFFQPGSMEPLLARAVANLAGARPGRTVLDPMCGTGGVLLEAGLVGADVLGVDAQAKMVAGARENLALLPDGESAVGVPAGDPSVVRGDATRLPFVDGAADGVVFDAPYGRQSKIERHDLADLVGGALAEAGRIATRAVLVADRTWVGPAREAGWTLEALFERRVHRSLTRYVHVLS